MLESVFRQQLDGIYILTIVYEGGAQIHLILLGS